MYSRLRLAVGRGVIGILAAGLLPPLAGCTLSAPNGGDVSRVDDGCIRVKGGSFQMGDVWGDGALAMGETPVHEVEVGDFRIGRHEVTIAEFGRFVEATNFKTEAEKSAGTVANRGMVKDGQQLYPCWRRVGWFEQGPDHPVVMVAWEDAIAYCNWLSREHQLPPSYDTETGGLLDAKGQPTTDVRRVRGYRLPTEAEWEFAARERGRKVRFGNGQNIARSSEMNFDAAGTGQTIPKLRMKGENLYPYNEKGIHRRATTPVGSFRPNTLGLHDMSGNAWEWCSDTGGGDYTTAGRVNPCAQGGRSHIIRGGQQDTDAKACRVSARIDWYPRAFCGGSGFRIARTAE